MLLLGDCLERMGEIPDGSVDMVLCDLPYGTTACKWDTVIPFEPLWAHYKRVTKPNAAIVLTASQPFTSALVMSNPKWFRYCWVWQKTRPGNFPLAKKQPLKYHEDVAVFCQGRSSYYPIMTPGTGPRIKGGNSGYIGFGTGLCRAEYQRKEYNDYYPSSIQTFPHHNKGSLHPTQKPVALMEYLIRTYTREGETVLDNTMGSGSTGVACINTGRHFIGIERDPDYFAIAQRRIADAQPALLAAE